MVNSDSNCVENTNSISPEIVNGILSSALFVHSPNYDERPKNTIINLLVIHCSSLPEGEYNNNNVETLLTGKMTEENAVQLNLINKCDYKKLSSHIYIKRQGDIIQFVPFDKRAWHAGVSNYRGRSACNNFSIGIELQGTDKTEYTQQQYQALIEITNLLLSTYPAITKQSIVGHSDIAPERKTDPGEKFDWDFYFNNLK